MLIARSARRIGLRLVAFALGAVVLALLAGAASSWVPSSVVVDLGQDSVQTLLEILATSMLAVTTFSLTAMISAYASAAAASTPRATQLLVEDQTSQRALSTFLGAFVFSVVGIAALSTEYYGEQGRVLMYAGTLLVIGIVVVTLLRWIHHLVTFGRMADVLDRVEDAARDAACAAMRDPHLGAAAPVTVPDSAWAVPATGTGIVTALDVAALERAAASHDAVIHLLLRPGAAVGRGEPLARVEGAEQDALADAIRSAVLIERHRTYEQDPRLGLVALAEIGSRALSPAVNDPGTAIEALNAIHRTVAAILETAPDAPPPTECRVHVPTVLFADLLEDALRPLARDGAGTIEVGLRLQKVVGALAATADEPEASDLREASRRAERRALDALTDPRDRSLIESAARAARGEASA